MWVTKLLISPGKIRIFCPKLAFLFILGRLIWCPVGGLVGGCGARAASRKTPIYFIYVIKILDSMGAPTHMMEQDNFAQNVVDGFFSRNRKKKMT